MRSTPTASGPDGSRERRAAVFAGVAMLAAGAGFSLASSASDAMFLSRIGAEHLGTAFALSSACLVAVLSYVGAAADRIDAGRLLFWIAITAGLVLLGLFAVSDSVPRIASVAVLVLVKQFGSAFDLVFWVVIAGAFNAREARRLLPVLVAVQGAGHAAGAFALDPVAAAIGAPAAVAVGAGLFFVAAVFAWRMFMVAAHTLRRTSRSRSPIEWTAGYHAVTASGLARKLAVVIAVAGAFAPILYYMLGASAAAEYGSEAEIAAFFGRFRGGVQLVILVIQLAIMPALSGRIGVATTLLVTPIGALIASIALSASRELVVVATAQAVVRVLDATIQSPGEKLTQNLLPRRVRGRVAGYLDGVAKRAGAIAGGLAAAALVAMPTALAVVTIGAALVWLVVAWRLRKRFPDLAVAELQVRGGVRQSEVDSDDATVTLGDERSIRRLREGLLRDSGRAVAIDLVAALGERGRLDPVVELCSAAAATESETARAELIAAIDERLAAGVMPGPDAELLLMSLANDETLAQAQRAVCLRGLGRLARPGQGARRSVAELVEHDQPLVRMAARVAVARHGSDPDTVRDIIDGAIEHRLVAVTSAALAEMRIEVAAAIGDGARLARRLRSLLRITRSVSDTGDRAACLMSIGHALARTPPDSAELILMRSAAREHAVELLEGDAQPEVRAAAVAILRAVAGADEARVLTRALGDREEPVRSQAIEALRGLGSDALEALVVAASFGRRSARNEALELLRDLPVTEPVLDELIERELTEICETAIRLAPLSRLKRGPLLCKRLSERIDEVAHTLLLLLETRLREPAIGSAALQFLRARNRAGRARALEALDTVMPRALSSRVLGALEHGPLERRARRAADILGESVPSVDGAIQGELESDDALARSLVPFALGRWGRERHRDAITAAAERAAAESDPFALVRRLGGDETESKETEMPRSVESMMSLSQVSLFAELSTRQLSELANVVTWVPVAADTEIVREGDPGDAMYFVHNGRVRVERDSGRQVVTELGPGEPFGEMALFEDETRNASVIAAEGTRVGRIARLDFEELVDDIPGIALGICRVLSRRLRER